MTVNIRQSSISNPTPIIMAAGHRVLVIVRIVATCVDRHDQLLVEAKTTVDNPCLYNYNIIIYPYQNIFVLFLVINDKKALDTLINFKLLR